MFQWTCVLVLVTACVVGSIPAAKADFPVADVASGNFRVRLTFYYDSTHPIPASFTTTVKKELADLFQTVPEGITDFAYLYGYDTSSPYPCYYFLDILPQGDDAKEYFNKWFYHSLDPIYKGTGGYPNFHRGVLSNVTAIEQRNCDGSYSYDWQACKQRNWLGIILGTTFAVIGFIVIVVLFQLWRQKKKRASQIAAASVVPPGGHAAGHKPPPAHIKPLFTKTHTPPQHESPPPSYNPHMETTQHHKHIRQHDEPEGEDLEAQPIKHQHTRVKSHESNHGGGSSSPRHHGSSQHHGGSSSPRGHHEKKPHKQHKSTRHSDSLP